MLIFQYSEQEEFAQLLKQIAEKELGPRVAELYAKSEFPLDVFNKLADASMYGVGVDEEFGGLGFDVVTQCLLHEELAKVDVGFAFSFFLSAEIFGLLHIAEPDNKARMQYVADKILKCLRFVLRSLRPVPIPRL